ncbi:MAG TPA: tRNA isopentenyl-2-thiomethyl-A-37 hydroxylase MiaE [Polyangia bacterium]|nr:tRNA isopentenyl-2-thiomethyl-A-37 hydroxylase MiaE [Polyangia bacterium]
MTRVAVAPSSDAWVRAACDDVPTLLLDHAHCEKKAASTAVRFLFKYAEWPRMVSAMSRLAREELVHFERVLAELRARGLELRALQSSGYAAALFACARAGSTVDELLVCALIEARSHERFERLAAAAPDPGLRALYAELGEAEARHGSLYVELAEEAAQGPVDDRLAELAAREATIVARPGQPLRMHSG